MQRIASSLHGYSIGAKDGDIGAVDDFLFDDQLWTVRYLVADTSRWLPGRRVVISPVAFGKIDSKEKRISVSLSKQQVENSPDLGTRILSREQETAYHDHFGWPYYWVRENVWSATAYPGEVPVHEREASDRPGPNDDPHLRSVREAMGCYIEAIDGDIGHVDDFIVDDDHWQIRYMIVDTKNWWPGKKVLISPAWIKRVSWSESRVWVDLSRQAIQSGPEFKPDQLNREYEVILHRHYGRPGYWDV